MPRILISEFLPNPAGKDANGEFIELKNAASEGVNLGGWTLKDESGKTFILPSEEILPGQLIVFYSPQTRLALNNGGEKIFLSDESGTLVDEASYSGSAAEGRSLIRSGGIFVFSTEPTPGLENVLLAPEALPLRPLSLPLAGNDSHLARPLIPLSHASAGLAIALLLSLSFAIIWKILSPNEADGKDTKLPF